MTMEDFWNRMFNDAISQVHTALPARILTFDAENMRAKIELLLKDEDGDVIPPILNCPVGFLNAGGFIIRPPFEKGDTVQVLFNEKAIDKLIISGKAESVDSKRVFSLDDATIVTGLKMQSTAKLPSENTGDLLISNTEVNSKIILKKNGDIVIESDGSVFLGSESATEGAALGNQLKTWLDAHVHPDPVSGSTGPPTILSPSPSTKVKVE